MDIKFLELILVAAVALGLGFWQLYDVSKELKKEDGKQNKSPASQACRQANEFEREPTRSEDGLPAQTPEQISQVSTERDE